MKMHLNILLILTTLTWANNVFGQGSDEVKYSKANKDGIGIFPGIEVASTPRNQSDVVFAPNITYSFEDNEFGLGPRIILNNTNSYSNATTSITENAFGIGANYRKFLTPTKHMFDFYVYYDMEYYNYNYSGPYSGGIIFPSTNDNETYKTNNYNFVTGFGFHLQMNKRFYMESQLGLGIGLEYGKHTYNGVDANNTTIPITDTYSNKSLVGQFKLGIGYIF